MRWTRFISFGLQRINVRNPERTDFAREPNWSLLISCFFTVPVDFPHMVKLYFARPNKGLKLHFCKRDQWKPRIRVMCWITMDSFWWPGTCENIPDSSSEIFFVSICSLTNSANVPSILTYYLWLILPPRQTCPPHTFLKKILRRN